MGERDFLRKFPTLPEDLPDFIHGQQRVGVEEGVVRDVTAAHVEEPLDTGKINKSAPSAASIIYITCYLVQHTVFIFSASV